MDATNLNNDVRAYFLEQGKSIAKLHAILGSNILIHHLRKWLSILLEISLYILFLVMFIFALWMPSLLTTITLNSGDTQIAIEVWNDQIWPMLVGISVILVFISLPILLFAILLGRNRKKNNLIREAFTEVDKMKKGFDQAVKDLKL